MNTFVYTNRGQVDETGSNAGHKCILFIKSMLNTMFINPLDDYRPVLMKADKIVPRKDTRGDDQTKHRTDFKASLSLLICSNDEKRKVESGACPVRSMNIGQLGCCCCCCLPSCLTPYSRHVRHLQELWSASGLCLSRFGAGAFPTNLTGYMVTAKGFVFIPLSIVVTCITRW